METRTALITGGSRGLGYALATALVQRGWRVIINARDATRLADAAAALTASKTQGGQIVPLAGDIADPDHRRQLVDLTADLTADSPNSQGVLDLLVNNASILGPSPQPALADYPLDILAQVYATNAIAPLALTQLALPLLRNGRGTVINISSDAAIEPYEGWGGYGSSKAALDQLTNILAAEEPTLRVYAFDPGDMATDLHQRAFPGEDISDRPSPESVVPALLQLVTGGLASGRYLAADLVPSPPEVQPEMV